MKTLEQVRAILSKCVRQELRDHAFGDCEVYWMDGDVEVGSGYFGGEGDVVGLSDDVSACFHGADARALRNAGTAGCVERNDSTGPAEYGEGECMPGLTLEGVYQELTGT